MQTHLAPEFASTAEGQEAQAIVRKCVHCGFCTTTCPTYQLLGDELDGPRGRIYLMKQVLEGAQPTRATQLHLDRCLTCRNCESTCPSGVEYGKLVEIGRRIVDSKVRRPAGERAQRWLLKEGLTSPLFEPAMKVGQALRPMLPATVRNKIPIKATAAEFQRTRSTHARKMLLLEGCVQPALMPGINDATSRVLDAAGIEAVVGSGAGCCGAIRLHLDDHEGGLADMRRNIDAWWPYVAEASVEAIVMNASGCGVTVKEYGHALAHDPAYAEKARRVSEITRDVSELLLQLLPALKGRIANEARGTLAYHPPCTLQHGQQLRGSVEQALRLIGFDVLLASEIHLCCGSAGTYSVLQSELAYRLRDRKLEQLQSRKPDAIVSGNIGCIQHLQSGTETPVRHWIEVLADLLVDVTATPSDNRNSHAPRKHCHD